MSYLISIFEEFIKITGKVVKSVMKTKEGFDRFTRRKALNSVSKWDETMLQRYRVGQLKSLRGRNAVLWVYLRKGMGKGIHCTVL